MNTTWKLGRNKSALILIAKPTEEKLNAATFQGCLPCAGNISAWPSCAAFLQDEYVKKEIIDEIRCHWEEEDFGTFSFMIPFTRSVGWAFTAPLDWFGPRDIEDHSIDVGVHCLRVRPSRTDLRAPQTQDITIEYDIYAHRDEAIMKILSIYPGEDIGELIDNVTTRERRVWFDRTHPGAY